MWLARGADQTQPCCWALAVSPLVSAVLVLVTLDSAVCTHSCPARFFDIPANTSTPGIKVVSVQLQTANSGAIAETSYRAFNNCSAPFGLLGDRPDCPQETPVYAGPDETELNDPEDFASACCSVSGVCGAARGWGWCVWHAGCCGEGLSP